MADETYNIRLNFAADLPSAQAAAMTPRGLSSFFTGFLTSVVYALMARAPATQVQTKVVTVTKTIVKHIKVHDMRVLQDLNRAKRVIARQNKAIQQLQQSNAQAQSTIQSLQQQITQLQSQLQQKLAEADKLRKQLDNAIQAARNQQARGKAINAQQKQQIAALQAQLNSALATIAKKNKQLDNAVDAARKRFVENKNLERQLLTAMATIRKLRIGFDNLRKSFKELRKRLSLKTPPIVEFPQRKVAAMVAPKTEKTSEKILKEIKKEIGTQKIPDKILPAIISTAVSELGKFKKNLLRQYIYSSSRQRLDPLAEFIRISSAQRHLAATPGAKGTVTGGLRYEHTRGSYVSTFGPEEARALENIKKITEIVNRDKARYSHLIRFGLPRYFYYYGKIDHSKITKEFVDQLQKMTVDTLGIQILKSIGGLTNKYGKLRDAVINRIEEINQVFAAGVTTAPPPINPVVPPELVNLFNQSRQIAEQTERYLLDIRDTRIQYELKARLQQQQITTP